MNSRDVIVDLPHDEVPPADTLESREYAQFRERYILHRTLEFNVQESQMSHTRSTDGPTSQQTAAQPVTHNVPQPGTTARHRAQESFFRRYSNRIGLAVWRWFQANWLLVVLSLIEMTVVGLRGWHLRYNILLYVITVFVRWMWNNIRVEGGNRNNDGVDGQVTTFLGKYFARQDGPDGRGNGGNAVCMKLGYIILKCAETFVLSLSPFYSTERLEMELQLDGVVREATNRLHATPQVGPPPDAPPFM